MQPAESVSASTAVETTRWVAVGSLLGLIVLGLGWELWLPAKPSLWALKVLPLCIPVAGLLRRRMYTYRWVSLLVWLYFMEGAVRAAERGWDMPLALTEVALSLILFAACALHVRLRLRNSKP